MRYLIALALVCAVVILGPDMAGPGAMPLAVWQGALQDPRPSLEAPRAESNALITTMPEPRADAFPEWNLRKFYEGIEQAERELFAEPLQPVLTTEELCEAVAVAAKERDLPAPFFARLIWQESRFDPRAVSPAGAQGVAQFMPKVAAAMGLTDPFDPRVALPTSAQLLQTLYRTFGNLGLAAAAYNAGPRRIQDWLARRGPLPEETRNYVRVITGHPLEKWIVARPIELPLALPPRAPCHGIAGLSRFSEAETIAVRLDDSVIKLIEEAKAAAARAKRAKADRALKRVRAANAAKAKSAPKKAAPRKDLIARGKSQDRVPMQKGQYAAAGR